MQNSILFLGTGGDSLVVCKQIRASGGIILRFGNNQFHLDPGPGAIVRAKQFDINPRENTAVFVSHNHLNHVGGLNAIINAITYAGIDKHGVLVCDEETLNGSDKEYPGINKGHKAMVEKFIALTPGMKIGINEVNIVATKTKHTDKSLGFKFSNDKVSISYVGDTEYFDELADDHKDSDVVIINCKNPPGITEEGHMNPEDIIKFLNKTKSKLAVLTHFGIKMLDSDPLFQAREIQKQTKSQIIIAKDGMVVNPVSYASSVKQRKLNAF